MIMQAYKMLKDIVAATYEREVWRGLKSAPSGTEWSEDREVPFVAISGNGVYGADANDEALVIGSADTPICVTKTKFCVSRINVTVASVGDTFKLRLIWGTGTMADAITACQTTEKCMVMPNYGAGAFYVHMPKVTKGTKIWAQARCSNDNATISFLVGVTEY